MSHRVRQWLSRTLVVSHLILAPRQVAPPAPSVSGRGLAASASQLVAESESQKCFWGALPPSARLFGATPHPGCTLLGHPWAERAPEEAGSGGASGPLSGVRVTCLRCPHPPAPHALSHVSSLTRHRRVPGRPCPQSPCGHCGHDRGPYCSGPRGLRHPRTHRWVPRHGRSCPALSHFLPSPCEVWRYGGVSPGEGRGLALRVENARTL